MLGFSSDAVARALQQGHEQNDCVAIEYVNS
jgi:hypothetical protein